MFLSSQIYATKNAVVRVIRLKSNNGKVLPFPNKITPSLQVFKRLNCFLFFVSIIRVVHRVHLHDPLKLISVTVHKIFFCLSKRVLNQDPKSRHHHKNLLEESHSHVTTSNCCHECESQFKARILIYLFAIFLDQAKQQRPYSNVSLDDAASYATFEMRQSRRGTLKSQRGTLRSMASRKSVATASTMPAAGGGAAGAHNFAMINGARAPPRPTPSLVRYSDEDDKGYDENPDDSDSLTEKPSEISSTDSQVCEKKFALKLRFNNHYAFVFQGTESEQESTGGSDPHSFVNHYANVTSTFRHSQTWKRQKATAAMPVQTPKPGGHLSNGGAQATSTLLSSSGAAAAGFGAAAALPSTSHNGGLHHRGAAGQSTQPRSSGQPQVPRGGNGSSTNPRGYSSFTDSDHDASSAVVSLNGTQIVMNNMARSRAPLPGFSSFV